MNKYEFLEQLEEQLRGAVSSQEVRESVEYYKYYIEEEMRKGRTEEEIFEDIGGAYAVAKSIIDAKGHESDEDVVYEDAGYQSGSYQDSYSGGYSGNYKDQSFGGYDQSSGGYGQSFGENPNSRVKVFRTDGWKGTGILIAVLILLVVMVVFAFRIFVSLLPFLIPFALILFLIKMFTGKR